MLKLLTRLPTTTVDKGQRFLYETIKRYASRSYSTSRIVNSAVVENKNFIVLGSSTAYTELMQRDDKKVLYFTASWCPPCKMIAPVFSKLSLEYSDILFVKIDIDDFQEVASEHRIQSVPTFEFINGAKVIDKVCSCNCFRAPLFLPILISSSYLILSFPVLVKSR